MKIFRFVFENLLRSNLGYPIKSAQDFILLNHINGITLLTDFNMTPEQSGKEQIFSMEPTETSLDYSINKNLEKDKTTDDPMTCGLFSWRPHSLQRFVSHKYYVLVYVIISISQSMVFSYLTVVLSTIEKQFGLKVFKYAIGFIFIFEFGYIAC